MQDAWKDKCNIADFDAISGYFLSQAKTVRNKYDTMKAELRKEVLSKIESIQTGSGISEIDLHLYHAI